METVRLFRIADEDFHGIWAPRISTVSGPGKTRDWNDEDFSLAMSIVCAHNVISLDCPEFVAGRDYCAMTYSQWQACWERVGRPDYSRIKRWLWVLDVPKHLVQYGETQVCFRMEAE